MPTGAGVVIVAYELEGSRMEFRHSDQIWRDFPELVAGAVIVDGISDQPVVDRAVATYFDQAKARLASAPEGEFPEIQAWRRVFARMGLKPTQYRCAAESLLRRFRKDGTLPRIHPLVDLLNAVSIAHAVPIAVFDLDQVTDRLEVGYAAGDEVYQTFAGATEHPQPGEVIFADEAGQAHARRWTHRQSVRSAVSSRTVRVLIVIESLHDGATADVPVVLDQVVDRVTSLWPASPVAAVLTPSKPSLRS